MNAATAIPEILSFADDSMALAKEALQELAAERRKKAPAVNEPITLTKVASADRIDAVARAIVESGVIPGSQRKIAKTLEQSDALDLLAMVEKLATTAVFPIFSLNENIGPMVLSEKPTGTSARASKDASPWAVAIAEYRAENS